VWRSLPMERACPGHGSFRGAVVPTPCFDRWSPICNNSVECTVCTFRFVFRHIQSGDENTSHTVCDVLISRVCACDELNVRDCVGVTVIICRHDARIPSRSICYCVGIVEFWIAVSLAPQYLAQSPRLQSKRVLEYMGSHFCHLAEHSNFIA